MLILNSTTDSLRVINNNAGSLDVVCSWMEHSNANPPVPAPADTTATAITGAATTTVVAAPASGVRRNVKTVHIRNKHASVSQDVEVVFTRSATDYSFHKVTLNPGEFAISGAPMFMRICRSQIPLTSRANSLRSE